jgi:septal ring factor EnvC (AmiA/AmiB activator)
MISITTSGLRNATWCAVAFGIVACASAPMPVDKLAVAKTSVERAEQAQAAQFAQVELATARNKLAAAQAAADKHDADIAARLADQADVDAQLAEHTARAKQQEELVDQMEASLRDLRNEAMRKGTAGSNVPEQPAPMPQTMPVPQTTTPPQQ